MDVLLKVSQAEFTLPGQRSRRQGQGRFDLHSTVETFAGELEKSAVIWLDASGRLAASVPSFTFHFNKPSSEATVFNEFSLLFVLNKSNVASGNLEIGRVFVPVRPNAKTHTAKRTVLLSRKLDGAIAYAYVGRICFEVSHVIHDKVTSFSSASQAGWLDLNITRKHLPLLVKLPAPFEEKLDSPRPASESPPPLTEQQLLAQEAEDSSRATHPTDNGLLTVIFHSLATGSHENIPQFNYQPVACISCEEVIPNSHPCCSWNHFISLTASSRIAPPISLLKSVSLAICDPTATASIHVLQEGTNTIVLSAKEFPGSLNPFDHYHRAWVSGHIKPTTLSDPVLSSSPHLMTSVSLLPPASHYYRYEGLEISVQKLELAANQSYKPALVAVRVMRNHGSNLLGMQQSTPFLLKENSTLGEKLGIHNYKLALLQYSSVEGMYGKAYLFFLRDSSWQDFSSDEGELSLHLLVYIIDQGSLAPWWQKEPNYENMLPLGDESITALLSDRGLHGVLWQPTTTHLSPVRQIDLVLRWKRKQHHFLRQDTSCSQLPKIGLDPATLPLSEQQHVEQMLSPPTSPCVGPAATVSTDFTAQETQLPIQPLPNATVLSVATPLGAPPPINNADHAHNALVAEYKAAIKQYGDDISRQKEENSQLSRMNHTLVQELEHLQTTMKNQSMHHYQLQPHTRRELEALPKVDLIEAVEIIQERLLRETAQKEVYQHKVQMLQNELIENNDTKRRLVELQQAHTAQQRLIHELQRKGEKYRKCYDTCIQQEQLIHELEATLDQNSSGNASLRQQKDPRPSRPQTYSDQPETAAQTPIPDARSPQKFQDAVNRIESIERMMQHFCLPKSHTQVPQSFTVQEERALHDVPFQQSLHEQEARAARLAEENRQLHGKLNAFLELFGSSINRQTTDHLDLELSPPSTAEARGTKATSF